MDFIKKILEFFTKSNDDNPFGSIEYSGQDEEMVITIHPDANRYGCVQYL